jgi:hypothetical protein
MRFENNREVLEKADWEGGIYDLANGYGVLSDDLPEGTPAYVIEAWDRLRLAGEDETLIQRYLEENYEEEE